MKLCLRNTETDGGVQLGFRSGQSFTGKLPEIGSFSPSYLHGSECKAGRVKTAGT